MRKRKYSFLRMPKAKHEDSNFLFFKKKRNTLIKQKQFIRMLAVHLEDNFTNTEDITKELKDVAENLNLLNF